MKENRPSYSKIAKVLCKTIPKKISEKEGLNKFVNRKRKFEGWLKVEIIDSLLAVFNNVEIYPEQNKIDVICGKYAIEIKVLCTKFSDFNTEKKFKNKRSNTKNINRVVSDINKFLDGKADKFIKLIVFIAYPLTDKSIELWNKTLNESVLGKPVKLIQFNEVIFENNSRGRFYVYKVNASLLH